MKRLRRYIKSATSIDFLTTGAVLFAVVLILAVAITYIGAHFRPLVQIEVPIASVKEDYRRGELVEGLFFGEVYYSGDVTFVRRLNCTNYTRVLPDIDTGKLMIRGSSIPKKLENVTAPIARVPKDAPTDKNCIISITNQYCVPYLFGCVKREYSYYTQAFEVLSKPPAEKIEQETPSQSVEVLGSTTPKAGSSGEVVNNIDNSKTINNTTNNEAESKPGLIKQTGNLLKGVIDSLRR